MEYFVSEKRDMIHPLWRLALGATVLKDGVKFMVWAPKVSELRLNLIEESQSILMIPQAGGYFGTFVKGLRSGAKYVYLLNEDLQRPDPVSRHQPEGVHGPSEVVDPTEFEWEDLDWRGIPIEEMILYEIHTGTFTPQGTFESILPLLSYLKQELGVTAIELMPVAQFPGERNWGYDGTYLYAPQASYGGPKGLKTLINACHQQGLAVLLDVVYNHLGPEGNYLGDFGYYFTNRYKTPWGPAVNLDGPESDDVRRFLIQNALYWVLEYHIDGLRIDAVHGIFDFSARHILSELTEAVHRVAKKLRRHIVVTAESPLNDARLLNPPSKGGYGLDAQWNDDFHHCLHTLLTGERSGYYQDFGRFDQLVKALQEGFAYSGQYSSFRKRKHGNSSKHLPSTKFVIFSQNHDQVGNRPKGDRLSTLVSFEALKLVAGMVLLSPNVPLLFMGEEYGEDAPFQYFVSHSDPGLIEAVRRGRKEEFLAFEGDVHVPDPQDEMTFLRSKINLELRYRERHKTLLELYKTLITLRKETPALSHADKKNLEIVAREREKILLVKRQWGEDQMVVVFNFNPEPVQFETVLERGHWEKVFSSASEEWGGQGPLVPETVWSNGAEVLFFLDSYAFALYQRVREQP
jgi:maltooligosyltrehalose trehalohydrolase